MLAPSVALVAYSAVIGLRVEEIGQVTVETAMQAAGELSRAIERRTHARIAIDDPLWSTPREGADVVSLRIFGGVTQLRVDAELAPASGGPKKSAHATLPRDPAEWIAPLDAIAAELFPTLMPVAPIATTPAPITAPPEPPRTRYLTWIALGTGAVAAAVGTGFGLSSRSARTAIETEPHPAAEVAELQDRLYDHGLAANVLFTSAAISAVAAVALYFLEP